MPDANPADGGQAPPIAAPPVGDPGSGQAPESAAADDPRDKQIAELRRESANYRKRAQELETAQKAKDDAELSELQKAQKRSQELEAAVAAATAEARAAQVAAKAAQLGFADPDDAAALLDKKGLAEGESIEDALKAILKAKPYLSKSGAPAPQAPAINPTNPGRPAGGGLTIEALRRMTAAEIARYPQEEILRACAAGS